MMNNRIYRFKARVIMYVSLREEKTEQTSEGRRKRKKVSQKKKINKEIKERK